MGKGEGKGEGIFAKTPEVQEEQLVRTGPVRHPLPFHAGLVILGLPEQWGMERAVLIARNARSPLCAVASPARLKCSLGPDSYA